MNQKAAWELVFRPPPPARRLVETDSSARLHNEIVAGLNERERRGS
jgi:hypothetical protein